MTTTQDPTLRLLQSFRDTRKWHIIRNVPIFIPHTREIQMDDEVLRVEVCEEDLPDIVRNSNALEKKGIVGRITDKHTIRWVDGKLVIEDNVRLLGFQRNYRLGRFGPNRQLAILADWYIYPQYAELVRKQRPYRSVEYRPASKEIRGVAALIQDPYLDMGMIAYSKEGSSMPSNVELTPDEQKLFEKFLQMLEEKFDLKPKNAGENFEEQPDESLGDELLDESEQEPEYESHPGTKSYDTSTTDNADQQKDKPSKADQQKDKASEADKKMVPMARPSDLVVYERRIAELQARLQGLELEREHERCQHLLDVLVTEGYQLSEQERKRELRKLLALKGSERQERLDELRKIYADRKPPTEKLALYSGPVEAERASPHQVPWWHEPAMRLMRANPGMSYDQAVTQVTNSKGGK